MIQNQSCKLWISGTKLYTRAALKQENPLESIRGRKGAQRFHCESKNLQVNQSCGASGATFQHYCFKICVCIASLYKTRAHINRMLRCCATCAPALILLTFFMFYCAPLTPLAPQHCFITVFLLAAPLQVQT